MIKNDKKIKVSHLLGLVFLVIALVSFIGYIFVTKAQTNYHKDSDYDGLSDQAEINIYHTDPLKADTDGDGYLDSAEVLLGSNPLDPHDPVDTLSAPLSGAPVKTTTISSVPWYVARTAGIVSYILMFLIVILGMGMTTGYIYSYINPVKAWLIHKYLSLALGLMLITHIISLWLDKFINLSLKEVFIPFYSSYQTIYLSLGIIDFYILLVIIFTSLWFRLKYKRTWRSIHYFVYALFIFSLIHGIFIGTDTKTILMKSIYIITGSIFFLLLVYRFLFRRFIIPGK